MYNGISCIALLCPDSLSHHFLPPSLQVVWLELQAWHARRSVNDQDLFLFTARQAIPDIIHEVLHFKVNYHSLSPSTVGLGQPSLRTGVGVGVPGASLDQGAQRTLVFTESGCGGPGQVSKQRSPTQGSETVSGEERNSNQPAAGGAPETNHAVSVDPWGFSANPSSAVDAAAPLGSGVGYREHLQRQRLAFEQVKRVMELLESVEALYPSLQTLQKDYEKYAARDFQGRVQALCLWLNITQVWWGMEEGFTLCTFKVIPELGNGNGIVLSMAKQSLFSLFCGPRWLSW